MSVTILLPLLILPTASSKATPTFKAVPMHLALLFPVFTGHGSGCKSSNIEFKANSHSLTGTRNLFKAEFSPLCKGSLANVSPS